MNIIKAIISFICLILIISLLNTRLGKTPPLGKILDPFNGIWQNVEADPFSSLKHELKLTGIKKTTYIDIDQNLIPHIKASNDEDLYFAIGYVSALHRLWKMDFVARATEGRLSEIFGYNKNLLQYDITQRQKGLKKIARQALKIVLKDPKAARCLKAFRQGINAYLKNLKYKNLPIEFKILSYLPEHWNDYKTMLFFVSMVDKLSSKDTALELTNVLKLFGRQKFDFLYPEYTDDIDPIIDTKNWNFKPFNRKIDHSFVNNSIPEYLPKVKLPNPKPKLGGSNNWALSGIKTKSGCPILANDPHLDITLPALFYLIHIESHDQNAIGLMVPGIPFLIIGFNKHMAWGMTNSLINNRDWYLMKFVDNTYREYIYNGKIFKAHIEFEEIKIRGRSSIFHKIIHTHIGPVFKNDLYQEQNARFTQIKSDFLTKNINNIGIQPKYIRMISYIKDELNHNITLNTYDDITKTKEKYYYGYSMRWTGSSIGNMVLAAMNMNKATNYNEFENAISLLDINLNYATIYANNDIAMNISGNYVDRWNEQGRFILKGDTSLYEWNNYIPREHNPKSINPKRGFVSSANQYPVYPSYKYYFHGFWFRHFRCKRINKLLSKEKKYTIQDMKNMQNDVLDITAEMILPILLKFVKTAEFTSNELKAYNLLEKWDYNNHHHKKAPSVYREWLKNIYNNLWQEIIQNKSAMRPPNMHTTINIIKNHPNSKYLNFGQYNDMANLIHSSFIDAIKKITEWEVKNKKPYIWQYYNSISLQHTIPIFSSFGQHNIKIGGSKYSLNYNEGTDGVSARFIGQICNNYAEGYFIYPGGQSGNPLNSHYTHFVKKWEKGEYIKLTIAKDLDNRSKGESIKIKGQDSKKTKYLGRITLMPR